MGKKYTRKAVLDRLKAEVAKGGVIFEAAVGSGISAKWSEAGGADLVATYNIAKYRMTGMPAVGYLPIGDANQIVLDLGSREILPVLKDAPLIAGVFGADPTRMMDSYLDDVARAGFSGVLNCPTLALVDGSLRDRLEKNGVGYQREVDMIAIAHTKDLFTQAFVTTEEEARKMVAAGADMILGHVGGTKPAEKASRDSQIKEVAEFLKKIFAASRSMRDDVLLGCHGGPIAFPQDLADLKALVPDLHAFLGGSAAERLPIEVPIRETIERFKKIRKG